MAYTSTSATQMHATKGTAGAGFKLFKCLLFSQLREVKGVASHRKIVRMRNADPTAFCVTRPARPC